MKFKQFFCQHKFEVKEATFQYGKTIPAVASHGLTCWTDWSYTQSTNHLAAPSTLINTHYIIKVEEKLVILCCKRCTKCGLVTSCDAFSYEEFKNNRDMLTMEGF